MKPANQDQMDAFASALQLCIRGSIVLVLGSESRKPSITFLDSKPTDEAVIFFTKIVDGKWITVNQYELLDVDLAFSQEFRHFLLLTRLVKENMLKAAEIEPSYNTYVQKLGLASSQSEIVLGGLEQTRKVIFDKMVEKKITFKELSQKSGLTSMALNNFKTGSDMRLSSFIKVVQALGLRLVLK